MDDGWTTPGGSGENSIDIPSHQSKFYVPVPTQEINANKQVNNDNNGENVSEPPTKNDNNDNKTTTEELTGKKHALKK